MKTLCQECKEGEGLHCWIGFRGIFYNLTRLRNVGSAKHLCGIKVKLEYDFFFNIAKSENKILSMDINYFKEILSSGEF